MTLRASARCCGGTFRPRQQRGPSGTVLDAGRMSTSTGAFGLAAVAGLVLGRAWTVYTNVFGASIYPSVNNAALDAPVTRRAVAIAARPATPAFDEVFASVPASAPVLSKPETVSPSIMFNERF